MDEGSCVAIMFLSVILVSLVLIERERNLQMTVSAQKAAADAIAALPAKQPETVADYISDFIERAGGS